MYRSCRWAIPLVAGLVGCGSGGTPSAGPSPTAVALPREVNLQVVKIPDLKRAIAAHHGRVIVMDVWADY